MAVADHILIAGVNRVDTGTLTAGSEVGTLVAANLQDRQPTKVWRSAGLALGQCTLTIDLGAVRILDLVALVAHNITQAGKWRVRLANVSDFSVLAYDSGWVNAWPVIGGYGALPWGIFNWGDLLPAEEASYYKVPSYHVLAQTIAVRYGLIEIDDPANPDLYVEAGRLCLCPGYRPPLNFEYGWQVGWVDDSTVTPSRGGQDWGDEAPRYRVLRLTLSGLSEAEIYANVFDGLHRRKGILGDVLVIPQPSRPDMAIHEALYGRLLSLGPITHPNPSGRAVDLDIKELL